MAAAGCCSRRAICLASTTTTRCSTATAPGSCPPNFSPPRPATARRQRRCSAGGRSIRCSDFSAAGPIRCRLRRLAAISPPAPASRMRDRWPSSYPAGRCSIETPRGERERRGRVILMTTPLDIDWGNLPFSNFYLPFTQSLVRYLSGGGAVDDRNLAPGEPIQAKLGAFPANRTVTLQRPNDAKPIPLELIRYGEQAEVRYTDTRQPGEYRMILSEEGKSAANRALRCHAPAR